MSRRLMIGPAMAALLAASGRPLPTESSRDNKALTGTFNAGRNAAKRKNRRNALIERCARRFRESWARETRNPAQGRPYGYPPPDERRYSSFDEVLP